MKISLLLTCVFVSNLFAQLDFKIFTDKITYSYGETIYIECAVSNVSDTAFTFIMDSYSSCQAEFQFDNYKSNELTICAPLTQEVTLSPKRSRRYYWTIDPKRFGIPNKDGTHQLIGYFSYTLPPYMQHGWYGLKDTIYFEAPMYLGGQINVGFYKENDSTIAIIKDSLDAEVLDRDENSWFIEETWQFTGIQIDTVFQILERDSSFSYVEYNRLLQYDSIKTITSIEEPVRQVNDFYLSNAFPNPFNPTTKFYLEIPQTDNMTISLFNILGEKVNTIYKGQLAADIRHTFEINGRNLSTGVYFYKVDSKYKHHVRKVILLK